MESLADISEPQILTNEKKINIFNFLSVYSVSMVEKQLLLPSKMNKQTENLIY